MTIKQEGQTKINNLVVAIVNKVTSLISTHNTNNSAHSDIRNSIPSKTSDLTNDSGFVTALDVPIQIINSKDNLSDGIYIYEHE